jgi:hypothetical protein
MTTTAIIIVLVAAFFWASLPRLITKAVADGIIRARSIEHDVKLIQEIQDDEKLTDEQKDVFIQAMFVRIPKILADEKLTNEQRQAAIKESFKSSHRE